MQLWITYFFFLRLPFPFPRPCYGPSFLLLSTHGERSVCLNSNSKLCPEIVWELQPSPAHTRRLSPCEKPGTDLCRNRARLRFFNLSTSLQRNGEKAASIHLSANPQDSLKKKPPQNQKPRAGKPPRPAALHPPPDTNPPESWIFTGPAILKAVSRLTF